MLLEIIPEKNLFSTYLYNFLVHKTEPTGRFCPKPKTGTAPGSGMRFEAPRPPWAKMSTLTSSETPTTSPKHWPQNLAEKRRKLA